MLYQIQRRCLESVLIAACGKAHWAETLSDAIEQVKRLNIYRHVTCKMACLSSLFGAILCGERGSVIVEEICRIGYNENKRSRRQSNGSEAGYL